MNGNRDKGPAKALRWGFSTGAAAAACAKAALLNLMGIHPGNQVEVSLPGGRVKAIPLASVEGAAATVIKDGGDDPDVTNGAVIGVRLRTLHTGHGPRVIFRAGQGVGTVTLPGLPIEPGEPAINPGPRKMIRRALEEALAMRSSIRPPTVEVEVFVEQGEKLAMETLNPRLGIVGGLSILGTTGLVRPFSHGAYRATIFAALKVARAQGLRKVVLTTGTTSDRMAQELITGIPPEGFVQMVDYAAFSMERACRLGFSRITVVCFMGKALKLAQGLGHTHASAGEVDLNFMASLVEKVCEDSALARKVACGNTARGALEQLREADRLDLAGEVGKEMVRKISGFITQGTRLDAVILDFNGEILWSTPGALNP